jgi:hypothetical protein
LKKKQHNTRQDGRLDLPFESHGGDWVEWVYDHRRGLLAAVAVYLLLAAGIATARISLTRQTGQEVFVDLAELEKIAEEKARLEAELQQLQAMQELERDYNERVRNTASNADGELNSDLRDAQSTQASDIYDQAQEVQNRMAASREAYQRGLQEAQGILDNRPQPSAAGGERGERGRAKGRVTVEYYLPGRTDRELPVPAYQCPGGGTVVVDIEADRNGRVVKASVSTSGSSPDPCLREYALRAARSSRFDVVETGPNAQPGTITYECVAQ